MDTVSVRITHTCTLQKFWADISFNKPTTFCCGHFCSLRGKSAILVALRFYSFYSNFLSQKEPHCVVDFHLNAYIY